MKIKTLNLFWISPDKKVFALIIALPVIINSLLLIRLGTDLVLQAYSLAAAVLLTLTGLVMLGERGVRIPDLITRFIAAFLVGLITFTALNFILLHVNSPKFARAVNALFFLFFLILGVTRRKHLFPPLPRVTVSGANIAWILLLSLVLSFTTSYGFFNNPRGPASKNRFRNASFLLHPQQQVPNWGWNKDKRLHMVLWCNEIARGGLPGEELQPNAIQVFFVSLARLKSSWNGGCAIELYKCLSLLIFFSFLYSIAFIGKYFFAADRVETALTVAAVPFFGAINYPLLFAKHSSYMGFFLAGTTMYHSITQVFCLMIGAAGIILILLPAQDRRSTFAYGCFLITGSFFFKPSLFAVGAPVIILIFLFYKRVPLSDKLRGFGLLLAPPLFWWIYRAAYSLHAHEVPIAFKPFLVLGYYAAYHFPASILKSHGLRNLLIVIFSFALFIPILIDLFITALSSRRKRSPRRDQHLSFRLPEFFFTLLFFLSTLSYALLVQNNNFWKFGNFGWGAAAGLVLFLPLLVTCMMRIRLTALRVVAGLLFCLHLWGGLYQLYIFTFRGVIF
ncbi:MAG: hypothetical protein RAO92_01865 [Candidatus Euphemobacter frigidus]|nr:hypothetical protein [Candidatus Euphemobacter frigidus]MDP8275128.1 hypothetical protein [Candidatus Euphemobacter frigidus]